MKFIKTAWSMMDDGSKLMTIAVLIFILSGICICVGYTTASIGVIISAMLIYCAIWKSLLKEEWQEFKEKVKLKMKEDKLKQ